ncbi:RnfH family protein [Methylophilus luteus]|uniref:UPF0125 protein ACFQ1Z_04935 n=1 Tax=Methylophilus luteus TaxID=640108 RepID=A0ABW3F6E1_9PROT
MMTDSMRETLAEMMTVEVAYALPQKQWLIAITVASGTTALQAVQQSGLLMQFPEIAIEKCKIGVFGKVVQRDQVLQAMDRVEIYRPLIADPKQARRLRAAIKNTVAEKKQAAKTGQQKRKSK